MEDDLLGLPVWSDGDIERTGLAVQDVPIVTVGGGLGSFAVVDTLRVAGTPRRSVAVVSNLEWPHETYRYLCRTSQIPDHERLRSDSGSTTDCVWGWPGYALREAAEERGFRARMAPVFQVLVEPLFTDYYTPRAGQVYRSVERECARIGWRDMLVRGRARMVRRRREGGYFTVVTVSGDGGSRRLLLRSDHVHLAMGYPGLRFLPDLQEFVDRYGDLGRIVNAYAPHEFIYEQLIAGGGTVLVRGSGIVASRILQRLMDDVEQRGAQTRIIHLFRTYVAGSEGPSPVFRRPGGGGFAYQGFNWPKGTWGGQLKLLLERLSDVQRAELLGAMGGTNTPTRKYWQRQIARGLAGGYYTISTGVVSTMEPLPSGSLRVTWHEKGASITREVDFVVDGTGLEASIEENRVFADLLEHGGARKNPLGRLDVEPTFEIRGTRSGHGLMYASGAATLGGYFAAVDSFLGLQYAALRIADDLAGQGTVSKLTAWRSIRGWWRWARNERVAKR